MALATSATTPGEFAEISPHCAQVEAMICSTSELNSAFELIAAAGIDTTTGSTTTKSAVAESVGLTGSGVEVPVLTEKFTPSFWPITLT